MARRPTNRHASRGRAAFLPACSLLFLALLVSLWWVENRVAETHWMATALTYLPQQPFLIPSFLLLLVSLFRRRVGPASINGTAILFAGFTILGARLPPLRLDPEKPDLRVMTFNIHGASHGVDLVVSVIREQDPDVFCLQEAVRDSGQSLEPAMLRAFPEYRFAREGALVTASRLPVFSVRRREFPGRGLWRKALQVDVQSGDRTVRVLNTHFITARGGRTDARDHLFSPRHWRDAGTVRLEQARAVAAWIEEADGAVVVVGDFNTPPRGLAYRALCSEARNAFDEVGGGFGYSWPAGRPLMRIDHVFTSGDAVPFSVRVPAIEASDHRPVVVDIGLAR